MAGEKKPVITVHDPTTTLFVRLPRSLKMRVAKMAYDRKTSMNKLAALLLKHQLDFENDLHPTRPGS